MTSATLRSPDRVVLHHFDGMEMVLDAVVLDGVQLTVSAHGEGDTLAALMTEWETVLIEWVSGVKAGTVDRATSSPPEMPGTVLFQFAPDVLVDGEPCTLVGGSAAGTNTPWEVSWIFRMPTDSPTLVRLATEEQTVELRVGTATDPLDR